MSELFDAKDEEPGGGGCEEESGVCDGQNQLGATTSRKEKRKAAKKMKRKQLRQEAAVRQREVKEAMMNDPEELRRLEEAAKEEEERMEREMREFEERERAWVEAMERKREEEERRMKALEESQRLQQVGDKCEQNDEDRDWDYVEEGPAEIIWQGNEIIVKKRKVKVPKKDVQRIKEDADRPTSNPLPPQSEAFADYGNTPVVSAQQILDDVAQQTPNFGTEHDKAHCPFHLKTGACRFGQRCSRVHFYPTISCSLLIKNMYSGPGLAWEQDEGLEHTDEEVERSYEEFYDDVHTEFLKFGEIVNFKVCRNGSFHLRGNVYVHYKSPDSAALAYHSINGRFFAGKQVTCEYVNVTKWRVAICGEYMRSRYKTCSHGTACNFIHCFRNPGGDYEWADWEKPPPRSWVKKMGALFGYPEEHHIEEKNALESPGSARNLNPRVDFDSKRNQSRSSRSRDNGSRHYYGNHGSENGVATSRSSEESDIYYKKQRKGRNGERNDEESDLKYSNRSSRTDYHDSYRDHHHSGHKEAEKHHQEGDRSKQRKVSEAKGDHEDTRKRSRKSDPYLDHSDSEVDGVRHDRSHKSSKARRKANHEETRERSEDMIDGSDRNNSHDRHRRRSRSSWSDSKNHSEQTIDLCDRWNPEDDRY